MRGTMGWEGEEAASLLANVTWAENSHSEEAETAQLLGGGNNPAPHRPWTRRGPAGVGKGVRRSSRTNRTERFPFFYLHPRCCSLGRVGSATQYSLIVEGKTRSKPHYHQKINSYCEALTKCQAQALSTQSHDESLA